jgi:hypothetical protein
MNGESPPEPDIEAALRQGAGRDWAEEAAEDEQLTELLRRRRADLGTRLREAVHRGERVRAEIGSQTFAGVIAYAGPDFATVARMEDEVDVVLDQAVWTIEPSQSGGIEQHGPSLTFRARLSEIAGAGSEVRIVTKDGKAVVGVIAVVAADHVEVPRDGHRVLIPTRVIAAVIRTGTGR